ncbi:MAG: M20/M25/M40 family metallo-hydrolase [Vicinamibacterales bacterium]|nr:M20/M25/M40 family metallo-hydrolase [Vicinamibacterales bacterium]
MPPPLRRVALALVVLVCGVCGVYAGRASLARTAAQEPDFSRAGEEAIRTLRALVRIDTSNPPGNETLAAEHVQSVLDEADISSKILALDPTRGNLVARLEGNGSKRPLLLMAHTDVVGVERADWTVDPFGGVIRGGHLYGRGASDDKGQLAAMVQVMLLLHRGQVPLARDVILLAESGEEGTTEVGIDFMVERHWDEIDAEFALNEGGQMTESGGTIETVSIATTEKVPWRGIKLIAHGTAGHGSAPRLDNPVVRLAAAVAKVGTYQSPMRLNETTRAYLNRLAATSPPDVAFRYRNLENPRLSASIQDQLREADIGVNSMLRTSISPNIISGGFRRNVIPTEAEAELDVRALPDEDLDQFLTTLRELIDDPAVELTAPTGMRPAAPPSSLDSELFNALERVQQQMFPEAVTLPTMLVAATDSAQIRAKGVQAYGVGMIRNNMSGVHGTDERISIEGLALFVEYLYRVVVEIAGAD